MPQTTSHNDDEMEDEELDLPEDEDATLADDLLDEVGVDDTEDADLIEGFGILPEPAADEEEEEKDDEGLDDEESLEEDAEDVDFDRFDDVDEM